MGRRPPCCDKTNVKRGLWTAEEDAKILAYVSTHGLGNWTSVPKKAGLKRCGKSCRLRYTNYLRPDLKRESFTPQEEDIIITLHHMIGSRWSAIAQQLPGRTDNDVKNYWNTKLKKKLFQKGIDPITHKPISQIINSLGGLPRGSGVAAAAARYHHTQKDARISCLNRDLKSVFMSRSESSSSAIDGFQQFAPVLQDASAAPPGYELLAQLHAIKFVSDVPSCTTNTELAPPPQPKLEYFSTNEGSSSSSNTMATSELNWSDFLIDDVVLCFDQKPPPPPLLMPGSTSSSTQVVQVGGEGEGSNCFDHDGHCTPLVKVESSDHDASFVDSFLSRDCEMSSWDFPQFLLDDPLDFTNTSGFGNGTLGEMHDMEINDIEKF